MSQRETAYTNAGSLMLETELSVFDVLALSSGVDRLLPCAGQEMVAVQQQTALAKKNWFSFQRGTLNDLTFVKMWIHEQRAEQWW